MADRQPCTSENIGGGAKRRREKYQQTNGMCVGARQLLKPAALCFGFSLLPLPPPLPFFLLISVFCCSVHHPLMYECRAASE